MTKLKLLPPSTRTGTVLILLALIGLGLLDNLYSLLIHLFILIVLAAFVSKNIFITLYRSKGVWGFFVLTGASLLWTEEGRMLAPVLTVKMFSMWLWAVIWLNWVGFERILSTLARLGIPVILLNIISFTARFLPILSERSKMMFAAQSSRGAKKGIHPSQLQILGRGIACLLLSSFEQSESVERAMRSRGFTGAFPLFIKEGTAIPYGSLSLLFFIVCMIWIGVICNVLCNTCA